ncbi:MAG TPA: methyltransferase domain-containing protein [Vicinamibacterales bacterium]|nr:methyltransferase domain-containing protein [Vicinamibacterales bacterium]
MTASERWLTALESRHFSDLTFQEVARSLRALSATYVERRDRLREGAALSGAGKRAAFAVFYGPLHYLLVREIVHSIPVAVGGPRLLIDLGCGTGAAGAAWAEACDPRPHVIGVDRHPWTLPEAADTYREFGLRARTVRSDTATFVFPKSRAMILAAFAVNELDDERRASLLPRLLDRASQGDRVLIVEPLARAVGRWWRDWQRAFVAAGGRADEWRFRVELPPLVAKLDRAAGLDHRELTGRSLSI